MDYRKNVATMFLFFAIMGPLKTAVNYLFEPVNCTAKLGVVLVKDVTDYATCVWGNVTGKSIA